MAEGARLESVFRGNSNVGSNPILSATLYANHLNLIKVFRLNLKNSHTRSHVIQVLKMRI